MKSVKNTAFQEKREQRGKPQFVQNKTDGTPWFSVKPRTTKEKRDCHEKHATATGQNVMSQEKTWNATGQPGLFSRSCSHLCSRLTCMRDQLEIACLPWRFVFSMPRFVFRTLLFRFALCVLRFVWYNSLFVFHILRFANYSPTKDPFRVR